MTGDVRTTRLALAAALGGLVVVLDTTITVLAVPVLMDEFDAPLDTLQWTTTAYLLALMTTLPLAAWLGTRFGVRRMYVVAMLVFAVGSLWAAVAIGPATLIAARVVQGLGGGLINPLGMALVMTGVPADRRGRVASLLGLPVLVGPLAGPLISGWLIDSVSWRAIFLVTVPPALLAALLVHRWGPASMPGVRVPVDLGGMLLLVPGATLAVYAVADAGAPTPLRSVALVTGLMLMAAFVARSLRRPDPLVNVRLLGNAGFRAALMVLALFGAAYFGSMLLNPTYVQITRGDSASTAALLSIPAGLGAGLTLQVATRLVDRVAPRSVVSVGLTLAAAAFAGSVMVLRTDTSYVVLGALAALLGVGAGAVLMPTMTAATRDLDGPELASGSTIMGLVQQLAGAFGTAGIAGVLAGLASPDAPATELVTAQRLTTLVPLALAVLALVVAASRLTRNRPIRKEQALEHATP